MRRILVVDDELNFANMIKFNLEATGEYSVEICAIRIVRLPVSITRPAPRALRTPGRSRPPSADD